MWYNLKHQLNRLRKNRFFDNKIIIGMITKEGRTKDGQTINNNRMKDGKIIKVIDNNEMASQSSRNGYNQNNYNQNNGIDKEVI